MNLFLRKCARKSFAKHDKLFVQGSTHRATYLIQSGLIKTFHESPDGKEITRGYWSIGDMIGGPYFFDDSGTNVWSAQAVVDSTVLAISGRDLRILVTHVPKIANSVLDALAFKLLWDSLLLQLLGTRSASSRLAHLLVQLSELNGVPMADGTVIIRYFTQEDIGNMIGVTRQWVNTQFKRFERGGILAVRNRQITIINPRSLKQLVQW